MKTTKGFEFRLKYGGVIVFLIYGFSRSLRRTQGHEKILFSNFAFKFRSHGDLINSNFHEKFQKFPTNFIRNTWLSICTPISRKSMQKTHVKIPNKVCRKLLKFFMEVTVNEISM